MSGKPKKDHTTAIIITFVVVCIAAFLFGVVFEILKFIAVVKWVFA